MSLDVLNWSDADVLEVIDSMGSEGEYPDLWTNLLGAWFTGLGPTGLALRDTSGPSNAGALTNMAASTAWVRIPDGHALTFDGSNDEIQLSNISGTSEFSMFCRATTADTGENRVFMTPNGWIAFYSGALYILTWDSRNGTGNYHRNTALGSVSTNTWYSVAVVSDGTSFACYLDGQYVGTHDSTSSSGSNYNRTRISDSAAPHAGMVSEAVAWGRQLSFAEVECLHRVAMAPLRPRQKVSPAVTAAAGYPWYYHANQEAVA